MISTLMINHADVHKRIKTQLRDNMGKDWTKGGFAVKATARWLVFLLLLWSGMFVLAEQAPGRPNVLFIYVDDLGYGDLGSYGHPVLETPNLDRLASEGVRLTNYYAPSALCSPSRGGVLTGRMPYRLGIKSWIPEGTGVYLKAQEVTLAELLKGQGYATALVGKWHLNSDLGSEEEPQPQDQGFEYFYGHNAFQIPANRNPTNLFRGRQKLPEQQGYTADLYADEAIRWLRERPEGKPFFLFLSMAEPHSQFENPPEYNAKYARFTRGEIIPIVSDKPGPPKEKLIPRGPGEYYANITYMDAQLGRVLAALKADELEDNTVVIFASDNGPVTATWFHWWEVNAYGSTGGYRGRKHQLYEGGIRVPAIVRYPGEIQAGTTSDALIVGMDWFTTLANMAGATLPGDRIIDGIDVHAGLQGAALPPRSLFWALPTAFGPEFAVRVGTWKLFLNSQQQPVELYDLKVDPLEFFNLLGAEPQRVAELQQYFLSQMATLPASGP